MMNAMTFVGRVTAFQPTTWVMHLLVAELIWVVVDVTPLWLTAVVLVLAVVGFGWREWGNYRAHKTAGHPMTRWIADGVGDMVGPVTVFFAAVTDPWVAHTLGLAVMALGTIAWVGVGYEEKSYAP